MSDLIRPDRDGSRRALPTHAQALETYWRQLELTPHAKLHPGIMGYTGRAACLRQHFILANGVISSDERTVLGMNWQELGVVPVGGQGLTPQERTWCAYAGQAMAAIFAEEAANDAQP